MNNNHYYSVYPWRVFKNNRFAGYVMAMSETDALRKAQEKFGKYIWIERTHCST